MQARLQPTGRNKLGDLKQSGLEIIIYDICYWKEYGSVYVLASFQPLLLIVIPPIEESRIIAKIFAISVAYENYQK